MFLYSLLIFHVNIVSIVGSYEREYVKNRLCKRNKWRQLGFQVSTKCSFRASSTSSGGEPQSRWKASWLWEMAIGEETQTTNSKLVDGEWTSMVRTRKKTHGNLEMEWCKWCCTGSKWKRKSSVSLQIWCCSVQHSHVILLESPEMVLPTNQPLLSLNRRISPSFTIKSWNTCHCLQLRHCYCGWYPVPVAIPASNRGASGKE